MKGNILVIKLIKSTEIWKVAVSEIQQTKTLLTSSNIF